jgi:transposase
MPIIKQASLFSIQDLYDLKPSTRFDAIFASIHVDAVVRVVSKKQG